MASHPTLRVSLLFLLLASFHVYVWNLYPRHQSPNVLSRVYLTLAIVDEGTLEISAPLARYAERWDVRDKAVHDGRYFTDKAPGGSWLLVPLAWILRNVAHIPIEDLDRMIYWLRVLGLSLPATLFWIWSRSVFLKVTCEDALADAVVLAGAMGTNFFVYATQLYSHVMASKLLFVSFSLIASPGATAHRCRSVLRLLGAGLLAGTAFLVDYLVVLAIPVMILIAIDWQSFEWKRGLVVVCGVVPPVLANLWYNTVCFGAPLRTGFHAHADPEFARGYQSGMMGMTHPTFEAAWGMLFSPSRGVVFLSPFLLLAIVGWLRLSFDPKLKRLAGDSIAISLAIFLFALTTIQWRGGWSVGSRYLVPAIPFAMLGVAGSLRHSKPRGPLRITFVATATVGIYLVLATALTFPQFPEIVGNPIFNLAIPMMLANQIAENMGTAHLGGWSSLPMIAGAVGATC